MDRRAFLQCATVAGITLMSPFGRRAPRAEEKRYDGPYWLLIHAGGGWDPTYLCDPKGDPINRLFPAGKYATAGNHRFAPIDYKNAQGNTYYSNDQFFAKYGNRLTVVNGIDTTTGNHDTGTRVTWSGRVGEGYPTFAALVAAARTPGNPLGFISSGGYEQTAGLTPLTRLGSVDAVRRIAYPDRIDPANPASTYHSAATQERIARMRRERLDDLSAGQSLPVVKRATSALYVARTGESGLDLIAQKLPSQGEITAATNPLHRQGLVALAGFAAGVAVAANISVGGFDTHGNHDANHLPRMGDLLMGIDLILEAAKKQGLEGKIIVAVGSDFGRTPAYNAQNGKDHWNITSMMFLGPGIPGNRVIGATDEMFRARMVNPETLGEDPGGTRIRCEHVHHALRAVAGVEASDVARRFPMAGAPLPLFAA